MKSISFITRLVHVQFLYFLKNVIFINFQNLIGEKLNFIARNIPGDFSCKKFSNATIESMHVRVPFETLKGLT